MMAGPGSPEPPYSSRKAPQNSRLTRFAKSPFTLLSGSGVAVSGLVARRGG